MPESHSGTGPAPGRARSALSRLVRWVSAAIFLVATIGFLGLAVGPHLLGYRTMTMLTGSMSPTIRPGDVIIDTPEPTSDLRVGQVITYSIPVYDHHVESHRVATIHRLPGGGVVFTTKGDANARPDPWTAVIHAPTVWQERAVVPGAGTVIRFLRQPAVASLARWAAPAVAVIMILAAIWAKSSPDAGSDDDVAGRAAPEAAG